MAKMNATETRNYILNNGLSKVGLPKDAIQYGNAKYAIPVDVEGETRYLKIEVTVGNNKDTKTTKAFNPIDLREEWLADLDFKASEKALKEERKKAKASTK